jgi:segregation and condensation protein B
MRNTTPHAPDDAQRLKAVIEALVFAAEEPLTVADLRDLFPDVEADALTEALDSLTRAYDTEARGLQIQQVAGGYRIATRSEFGEWVRALFRSRNRRRLSGAALETLAIVAYRQPITTPEIHALRGTDPGGVLQNLLEKKLVRVVGRKKVVGRPVLYGTTRDFLSHFGLNSVADLPSLEEFGDMASALQAGSAATPATGLPFEEHAADDDGAAGNGGHEDRVDDDEIERKDDGDHS